MKSLSYNQLLLLASLLFVPIFSIAAPLTPPSLRNPGNNAPNIQLSNINFNWGSSVGATSYRIVISMYDNYRGFNTTRNTCDSTCITNVVNTISYTSTTNLLPNYKYFWKVQAIKANTSSAFSSSRSFTTTSITLSLPFDRGQTWYVCQGYNGSVDHAGAKAMALDLVNSNKSIGSTACYSRMPNVASGQNVRAPGNGVIKSTASTICFALDNNGGSITLGYLTLAPNNTFDKHLNRDDILGTLNNDSKSGGGISHIHMQLFSDQGCKNQIPFGTVFGNPNLSYDKSITNQWFRTPLTK